MGISDEVNPKVVQGMRKATPEQLAEWIELAFESAEQQVNCKCLTCLFLRTMLEAMSRR